MKKTDRNEQGTVGFVYVLGCAEGFCKIGRCRYIDQRIDQLAIQLPFKVSLLHMLFTSDAPAKERELHRLFRKQRANGEWFRLSNDDLEYIAKVQVFYSDLLLVHQFKKFYEAGEARAMRGVKDLYDCLPNHVIPIDAGIREDGSIQ